MSFQDEPNSAQWLVTGVALFCLLRITGVSCMHLVFFFWCGKALLTKLVCWILMVIGLVLFFAFICMDLHSVLVHNHAKKELGQYPAILTSHLISNPHINYLPAWLNNLQRDETKKNQCAHLFKRNCRRNSIFCHPKKNTIQVNAITIDSCKLAFIASVWKNSPMSKVMTYIAGRTMEISKHAMCTCIGTNQLSKLTKKLWLAHKSTPQQ